MGLDHQEDISGIRTNLEDPLIHKKVLQTVFGIRAFFSAQIQFEHFLRLPRCLVKCWRENEPATRAQFPAIYPVAIFRNSGAIPKSVQSQSSAPQSVRLHVFAFTVSRALICYKSSSKHLCINGSCRNGRVSHRSPPLCTF